MAIVSSSLDELDRDTLVRLAHEYMLLGMIVNRGMLPQVVLRTGSMAEMDQVAIELWMGASPNYTARTRRLMKMSGDDVAAIMKPLQLDCGFVHEYMDVHYVVHDEHFGEFWLPHCGALVDAEPYGEERVFGMCHTIEDPTFDATALAVNPRAAIRPIHRPPREPADRMPHCHWTIRIDPDADPVGPARYTQLVADLPLTAVPNERIEHGLDDGLADYSGPFEPDLKLPRLDTGALAAMAREFQVQAHLLVAAGELSLTDRYGIDAAHDMIALAWLGAGWVASERLDGALGGTESASADARRVARVLALTPALPPGFDRHVEVDGDTVRVRLVPVVAGLLDAAHPGLPGVLARGDVRPLEGMVHPLDRRAAVTMTPTADDVTIVVRCGAGEPVGDPDTVALMHTALAATWTFTTVDPPRRRVS